MARDNLQHTLGERHRPLRDIVGDEIRNRIIRGDYAPGYHLVEDRLAQELGVSRNPVRETLRVLEAEGFVEMIPRRGSVVATLSDDEVREVFEVRTALEALAARLAARKVTEQDAAVFNEIIESGRAAVDRGDLEELVSLNTRFHELVLTVAGNGYLRDVMLHLRGRMQWIYSRTAGSIRGQHSVEEHEHLAQAIADGDEEASAVRAVEHVDAAAASYWRARAEQPDPAPTDARTAEATAAS